MTESWDTIADWYAERLQSGSAMHDFSRDILLDRLPPRLDGQHVLDLGCGEGIITRALAARGVSTHGIDPSPRMIAHAQEAERLEPSGATFTVDDGCTLATIATASMDWVTAGLSLNNVPDLNAALTAVRRVLTPGGSLAFTIPHPCFETPHATWTETAPVRRVIGDYLTEGFWRSANPEGARRAGNQHRTLSTYLTALIGNGFALKTIDEPAPDATVIAAQPHRAGLPPFIVLHACRA
ncbi:Ubiquinone/menaquinone biosynthesis C-methyltransferase UbiE [Streptomyces sp. RB5]|uniref:Ubiquinone/menaquinone biosynthesis C-methyltransferase UbiE n=1 Tax=Streptomyces smaragdinus TaxID=2585196 RepID=A0A7K0CQF5_9ACTN|nr:class I SAM-dependent methyltransferase [Streptomyces smaragdinus]MQY15242.1 Ubiquinone/menaquinone biosynthesis C-methyltransferase UbiE [Streptomyces smaragdinus]